jgi:type IX secretion system PorP/SprF family membrane protein
MKRIVVFILSMSVALVSLAQDPHFSMFYASPQTLNPAMTGAFNGNYRFSGIYRGQWGSILHANEFDKKGTPAFRTYSANVDFRTSKGFMPKDAFGVGFVFLGDKAGAADYGTIGVSASLSYFKSLNYHATQYLALGFQGGFMQRTINTTKLTFGTNYDGLGYNPNLPTDPSLFTGFDDRFMMYNVSFGLLWFMKIKEGSDAYLGFAMDHLNRPNESFYRGSTAVTAQVPFKFTAHGGVKFPLGAWFTMAPKFIMLYQGKQWETNFGTDVRLNFYHHEPAGDGFALGLMYRLNGGDHAAAWKDQAVNSESFIITSKIDYHGLSAGVAYDINTGEAKIASRSKGAFEIFAGYQGAFKARKNKTQFCPRW